MVEIEKQTLIRIHVLGSRMELCMRRRVAAEP